MASSDLFYQQTACPPCPVQLLLYIFSIEAQKYQLGILQFNIYLLTNTPLPSRDCQVALEQGTSALLQQSWSAAKSGSLRQCNSLPWMSEDKLSKAVRAEKENSCSVNLCGIKEQEKKKNHIILNQWKHACLKSPEQESKEGKTRYVSLAICAETVGWGVETDKDKLFHCDSGISCRVKIKLLETHILTSKPAKTPLKQWWQ